MSTNRLKVLLVTVLAVFAVSAVASASASAFKFEWEAANCEAKAGGKYSEKECNKEGGATEKLFELNFKPLTGTETRAIDSEGLTEFKLTAGGKTVTCKTVTDEGTVGAKGEDDTSKIEFTGCTANAEKCWAFSPGAAEGTIVVTDLDTQLVERETSAKAKVLADEFKENDEVGKKEFVTLEFEEIGETGEDSKACPNFPTTKVTGQVAAIVENQTSGEENGDVNLNFPSPELKGNTLKAFGVAATLTGTVKTGCKSEPVAECEAIRGV